MRTRSMSRWFAWTLPALVVAVALASCVSDDTTPVTAQYQTAVTRVMQRYHVPGALVSVRYPGEAEWKETYGFADLARRTPVDPQSRSPIRSVTKSFTTTLILQLVRDQALTLDDKLERFVPGIPNGTLITIADLAGMQSGIADYSGTAAFEQLLGPDPAHSFTEQELVDFAIPFSPVFAPGQAYQYCNTNTVLLGMIAEKVMGVPLADGIAHADLHAAGARGHVVSQHTAAAGPASDAVRRRHQHRSRRGIAFDQPDVARRRWCDGVDTRRSADMGGGTGQRQPHRRRPAARADRPFTRRDQRARIRSLRPGPRHPEGLVGRHGARRPGGRPRPSTIPVRTRRSR